MKKQILVVCIVFLLVFSSWFGFQHWSCNECKAAASFSDSSEVSTNIIIPISHCIEGVPYIGQETDFFCAYATITMVYDYHGLDTSLEETLFHAGVGYSLVHIDKNPLVLGGFIVSQGKENLEFLADIYNSTVDIRAFEATSSNEDPWDEYWTCILENITLNHPVIVSVNVFELPSFQEQFDVHDTAFEDNPPGHGIVIVGFNTDNNSVCYHDPAAALYGDPSLGTYAWMSIENFQQAAWNSLYEYYTFFLFTPLSGPVDKEQAFHRAHERNMKKLNGEMSAYTSELEELEGVSLGVNAAEALQRDFSRGFRHRLRTILLYKLFGTQNRLILRQWRRSSLRDDIPYSFYQQIQAEQNDYGRIGVERDYMVSFLLSSPFYESASNEHELLEQEAEAWYSLADDFSLFLQRGFFLSTLRSVFLVNRMKNTMGTIIDLHEQLLDL